MLLQRRNCNLVSSYDWRWKRRIHRLHKERKPTLKININTTCTFHNVPFNALCSLCAPSTENTNYAVKMESKIVQFYKSEEKIAQKYFQTLRLAFLWIRFNLLFAKQALSHIQYVQEQTVIGHNHRNNAWHLQSLTHLFRWLLSLQGNCGNLAQFLPAIGWTCTDYCDCAITNARRDSAALLYEWCWLIFCPIQILAVAANNIQVGTGSPRYLNIHSSRRSDKVGEIFCFYFGNRAHYPTTLW